MTKIKKRIPPIVRLHYKKGELLMKQGDYGISIYKILKGHVRVFKETRDSEIPLATLGPSEILGEMTFLNKLMEARTASARAVDEVDVEVWHPARLTREYEQMPPILQCQNPLIERRRDKGADPHLPPVQIVSLPAHRADHIQGVAEQVLTAAGRGTGTHQRHRHAAPEQRLEQPAHGPGLAFFDVFRTFQIDRFEIGDDAGTESAIVFVEEHAVHQPVRIALVLGDDVTESRAGQHRRRRLTTFSIDASPQYDIPDNSQVGLERALTRDEEQEQVHELLDTLGPKDRLAVIMRYWYDYSYEEIAESLSLSVSAVKSRLHRARRDLASEWLAIQPKPMMVERTGHGSPAF